MKFLRYNAWILFYPIGFLLECKFFNSLKKIKILVFIFIRSILFYYNTEIYSLKMPNSLNMSFNFGITLAVFTFILFPYSKFFDNV